MPLSRTENEAHGVPSRSTFAVRITISPPFGLYLTAFDSRLAMTRSISGTGVGLAGTRHIVEEHAGEIGVESELGVGTTFRVLLPLLRDQPDDEFEALEVGAGQLRN